ncbi:MAG: hypothetical protein MZU84_03915 [Sphingobacterium sp.]|nr:hypothetical protein [Sphingobacterium sp.]
MLRARLYARGFVTSPGFDQVWDAHGRAGRHPPDKRLVGALEAVPDGPDLVITQRLAPRARPPPCTGSCSATAACARPAPPPRTKPRPGGRRPQGVGGPELPPHQNWK